MAACVKITRDIMIPVRQLEKEGKQSQISGTHVALTLLCSIVLSF